MQTQLRHQQLQPTVLILHRLQPLRLAHVHPAELLLPAIRRRRTDPMLTAHICRLHTSLMLLQDPDDLLFRMPAVFIVSSLAQITRELQVRLVEFSEGRSHPARDTCRGPRGTTHFGFAIVGRFQLQSTLAAWGGPSPIFAGEMWKNATEPEEDEACEAKAAAAAGDQSGALQNLKTTRTRTDVSKLGTSQVEAHLSSRIASGTSGTGERNSPG